jgi:hypothetical protein
MTSINQEIINSLRRIVDDLVMKVSLLETEFYELEQSIDDEDFDKQFHDNMVFRCRDITYTLDLLQECFPDVNGDERIVTKRKVERIQMKRTKGWRMPANTIYVGRPTKWGNPFKCKDSKEAVDKYEKWLLEERPDLIEDAKRELRGRNLACWCPLSQSCHAMVLIWIANFEDEE